MVTPLAAMLGSAWCTRACQTLSENRTWKALGVEVLGINLPKTAIVRTRDEAIDVGVNEFGNTLGFFGGIWGGSALVDRVLQKKGIALNPNAKVLSQGRLMKSLALIPPLFALMVAMPFFRNAFTAWRAGTTDYKALITEAGETPAGQQSSEQTQKAVQRYVKTGLTIAGSGLALGLLGFGLARGVGPMRLFKNGKLVGPFAGPWGQKLLKAFSLTGPRATEFGDLRAVAFWGIPAYLGWMAASRDKYEVKEQFLKLVNFILVYLYADKLVGKLSEKKAGHFAKQFPQLYTNGTFSYRDAQGLLQSNPQLKARISRVIRFENGRLLGGFGSTVVLMAVLPALINIHLTRRRLQRAQAEQPVPTPPVRMPQAPPFRLPAPSVPPLPQPVAMPAWGPVPVSPWQWGGFPAYPSVSQPTPWPVATTNRGNGYQG